MARSKNPAKITIDLNLGFPSWTCAVRHEDGRVFRKFRTFAQLFAWVERNGYVA